MPIISVAIKDKPWYWWRFTDYTLRKKTEPKRYPLGTVLKNGAVFSKKGIKRVPLWQSAPYQKGTVFQNSALRAPFSKKG